MSEMKLTDVYDGICARKVQPGAAEFLFELIQERMTEPEVNISATMPTWEEHRFFVESRPYNIWYLVEIDSPIAIPKEGGERTRIGYVSATDRNEIGIVLAKAWRGQGYGPQALQMFIEGHQPLPAIPGRRVARWLANINPKNERSIGTFRKLGFTLKQCTYQL